MEYIINLSCPDRLGLVRTVSGWLFDSGCNILDSDQFLDADSSTFFMRVHFDGVVGLDVLKTSFEPIARTCAMTWQIWSCAEPAKVLVMVSRLDHCLLDLIYRVRNRELDIKIPLIVSNHPDAGRIAHEAGIEFLHLPVTAQTREACEAQLLDKVRALDIDFIVLARYMQILSGSFCSTLPGRIVNIHHSFLPGFKGAKPYHQAHEHGVKLIGATAHFVTADLDEGPIIEQGVERVDHRKTVDELVATGRDVERIVLAKAVRYLAQHRVLLNGQRTVVFD